MIRVVTYATSDYYHRMASRMVESAKAVGLEAKLTFLDDMGSWSQNTLFKPTFLRKELDATPDRHLLWIDANAIVHEYPSEVIDLKCDIGAHIHRRYPVKHSQNPVYRKNLTGFLQNGTLFVRQSDVAREVLDRWIVENEAHPEWLDQFNLARVLRVMNECKFLQLTPEYSWIEAEMRSLYPKAIPIIEHFDVGRGRRGDVQ